MSLHELAALSEDLNELTFNPSPSTQTGQTPSKTDNKSDDKSGGSLLKDVGLGDKGPLALDKKAAEDVAGSLKIHVKLALEIDIQITARIKGDIAIGIAWNASAYWSRAHFAAGIL